MAKTTARLRVHHVALQTACFEKSLLFYTDLIGLKIVKPPFIYKGNRTLAWLDGGSILIELYSLKQGEEPKPYDTRCVGFDHVAFEVEDLDVFISYLAEQGVRIIKPPFIPPTDDPTQARIAIIAGPDEETIEIREVAPLGQFVASET